MKARLLVTNPGTAETGLTIATVSRSPSSAKGPRPAQGARLLRLRQAAGLTQIELGKAIGVPHSNIAHWEWSEKPPRGDVLPLLAQCLHVSIDDIVGVDTGSRKRAPKRSGPLSEAERTFDVVRRLPRNQQRRILEVVKALIHEYGESVERSA